MESGGGQSDQYIANFNFVAGDDLASIDNANDKSGQIILAPGIEARHLGGLAANQGTAVVAAGFGDSFDNLLGNLRVESPCSQVIHEEERGSALYRDVVDAMVHQVAAHGVMKVHHESNFQLGANAIDARNQHGITEFFLVDGKQATES